jgi:hypothetical protein
MNWTCLVYGGPMFAVTIWWFVSARKWFHGPKVNIEHMMLGREGNVIQGKDKLHDSASETQSAKGEAGGKAIEVQ